MDNLLRRLKYYGIGFGMGLIFVFFFFQNRGCSWLPGNRIKNSILDRVVTVNTVTLKSLEQKGISKEDIVSVLNDGDVNFSESKKDGNPQVYVVEKEIENNGMMKFYFSLPKESFVSEMTIEATDAKKIKNSTSGIGELIHFPKDENLVFPDTTAYVTCQQEALGLIDPREILKAIEKNGYIDFSKSNFDKKPKAEQYVFFVQNGDTIGFNSFWYQNKINISSFEIPFETNCK